MKSNESKPGKRTSISIFENSKVPKLLTYSNLVEQLNLAEQLKKIDIGTEIDPDYLEVQQKLKTLKMLHTETQDNTFQLCLPHFIFLRIAKKI